MSDILLDGWTSPASKSTCHCAAWSNLYLTKEKHIITMPRAALKCLFSQKSSQYWLIHSVIREEIGRI